MDWGSDGEAAIALSDKVYFLNPEDETQGVTELPLHYLEQYGFTVDTISIVKWSPDGQQLCFTSCGTLYVRYYYTVRHSVCKILYCRTLNM